MNQKILILLMSWALLCPQDSYAQGLKSTVFGNGSTSTVSKVSRGNEIIKIITNKDTTMTGSTNSQTMSFNLAGNGVDGEANGLVIDLIDSNLNPNSGNILHNKIDGSINGSLTVGNSEAGFSLTGQINHVNSDSDFDTIENSVSDITRDDTFRIETFSESFNTETGTFSGL